MKLYFATPSYQREHPAHKASRVLTRNRLGVEACEFFVQRGDSCLARARATLLAGFLEDRSWTHLVQIDDDQSWGVEHLLALVALDLPLVGLRSAFKSDAPQYAGMCTTRWLPGEKMAPDGTVEVQYLGGGFVLWRRDALRAMAERFPRLRFVTNVAGVEPRSTYSFWTGGVWQRELLSEDYWASHLARRASVFPRVYLRACSPHWFGDRAFVPRGYAQPQPQARAA